MVSSLKGQSKVLFFGCTTFYRPRCPLSVYMALCMQAYTSEQKCLRPHKDYKRQIPKLWLGVRTFAQLRWHSGLKPLYTLDIFSGQLLLLSGNNWGNETIGIADTLDECRHSNRS